MAKKKKTAQPVYRTEYEYKCRNCGTVFTDCESVGNQEDALRRLSLAVHTVWVDNQIPLPMLITHRCAYDTMGGIADLIGFKMVEEL